jgi:hypothetical protein
MTGVGYPERHLPALSQRALGIFTFGLTTEARKQNRAHVAFIEKSVVNRGWPKRSEIGPASEKELWLIVQHADQDPV